MCVWRPGAGCRAPREGPLLGTEARGSPEGTARLEEPLAGQRLNKRWEGSVSLEGRQCWEAPRTRRGRKTDAKRDRRRQERRAEDE